MELEMALQMVEYGAHVKICESGTEIDVARSGWRTDEARERKVEDLRVGRDEVVEELKNAKGSVCASSV
jgi:hypothetical protein